MKYLIVKRYDDGDTSFIECDTFGELLTQSSYDDIIYRIAGVVEENELLIPRSELNEASMQIRTEYAQQMDDLQDKRIQLSIQTRQNSAEIRATNSVISEAGYRKNRSDTAKQSAMDEIRALKSKQKQIENGRQHLARLLGEIEMSIALMNVEIRNRIQAFADGLKED